MRHVVVTALALFSAVGALPAQQPASVQVRGNVPRPITLGPSELARLRRDTIVAAVHGDTARYAGVPLGAVLRFAGVPMDSIRGTRVASYVLLHAADGYRALFALAELDPSFSDRRILLADLKDGITLPPAEAPFRVVVSDEKRATRWIRQVVAIEVVEVPRNGER